MKEELQKYKKLREIIFNDLKTDLIGPYTKDEILKEAPVSSYITGMLYPEDSDLDEQEEFERFNAKDHKETFNVSDLDIEEEDEEIKLELKSFKKQSSLGFNFYIGNEVSDLDVIIRWGDYYKGEVEVEEELNIEDLKKKKKKKLRGWVREEKIKSLTIKLSEFKKEKKFEVEEGIYLIAIKYKLKRSNNLMMALYLVNKRETSKEEIENIMFQVEIEAFHKEGQAIFASELDSMKNKTELEDFIYREKPVFSRGYGCATIWENEDSHFAKRIKSTFIPEHEIPGASTVLEGIDDNQFSMALFSNKNKKDEIIERLNIILNKYSDWIDGLRKNELMNDDNFKKYGNEIIGKCKQALSRIEKGIYLLNNNERVLDSFCFANQVMLVQNSMSKYAKDHSKGVSCSLKDYIKDNDYSWRPFQIAFILLNIEGIINPKSEDRNIVDLLFFPTGGGKTEAYLGLAAFLIAMRRLSACEESEYEKDGGVTIFLRYTLRLLTTQQRDRLLKMICAAEMIRKKKEPMYGKSEISIGFWVGGQVTPNKFDDFVLKKDDEPSKVKQAENKLAKQIIKCPCCGNEIKKEDYIIDLDSQSVEIYCSNKKCYFYKNKIPVYLVDEEIYSKCPTVIISTVDKFANLPWDYKTALLFGKTDRYCPRDGYLAVGEEKHNSHKAKGKHKATKTIDAKPFYPPELIIQDELHLITGPLGTIYGGYETAIDELCKVKIDGKDIGPKYIVSTATIKNAHEQIKKLYGRDNYFQFPPSGVDSGDSYFGKEVSLTERPFRFYGGVCATGQSMKTTLLRVYAVLLQATQNFIDNPEYKDYLDPYRTLIGYFNSIRELGGTVRLLDDDIPDRLYVLKEKYKYEKQRYINVHDEITSRTPSYKIPQVLENLEKTINDKCCMDVAIATNMIAVGMDIDRLGLMVVTGQPKLTSEYIQSTSRVGRKYPGLVITIYNPYRPRDLSHYENFVAYHSQLYRYVEGTTATPFAARARDRVLHAIVIALLRLRNKEMAPNSGARNIDIVAEEVLDEVKNIILNRVQDVEPLNLYDTQKELDVFIDDWKRLNEEEKDLFYYVPYTDKYNRLINYYDRYVSDKEKATLNSMREVESPSSLYYWEEV